MVLNGKKEKGKGSWKKNSPLHKVSMTVDWNVQKYEYSSKNS